MKLLLVDGHYHVYRAFHAIRILNDSSGNPTNAIFGFLKALRRMVKDLSPTHGAVIWDEGLPARRMQLQPAYKQQRPEMPEPMRPQLDRIREIVPLLGFASLSLPGTEADDLMASYAVEGVRRGWSVALATNDKDLFQMATDSVRIYSTSKHEIGDAREGFVLLGPDSVRAKWGVEPGQIADILALTGDSADNIPGVPGLGPKGASQLIREFGSARDLLERAGEIANPKLREKIVVHADQIRQNREMVRLDEDLPLPLPADDLAIRPQPERLLPVIERLEFKTMADDIRQALAAKTDMVQGELF
jgi:DNA polymerase-1